MATISRHTETQKTVDFKLTGVRKEESVDMYIQNISRKRGESLKEISDKVRVYCNKKGVRVMNARTITNKYCEDSVRVKLTIPLRQFDDAIGTRMWPDELVWPTGYSANDYWWDKGRRSDDEDEYEHKSDNRYSSGFGHDWPGRNNRD